MSEEDEAEDEMFCERHNLENPAYERTDPHCPYCRMEERRNAEMVERAMRHPPRSVDDPASIDFYRD